MLSRIPSSRSFNQEIVQFCDRDSQAFAGQSDPVSTERHQYDLAHVREELFKAIRESGCLCRLQAHLGIQCNGVARIRDDQEIDFLALFGAPGMLSVGENQSPRVASKPVPLRGDIVYL